jgi:hypothetical protein
MMHDGDDGGDEDKTTAFVEHWTYIWMKERTMDPTEKGDDECV